jgi:hypothetical protein
VLPSNTQVSVDAVAEQDVCSGQFEQMTSVPVEGLVAPDASGQMPHVDAVPEVVTGHIRQAMAGFATPGPGLAVTGQIGQAIIAVAQEIGQAVVDCATGGRGHMVDAQVPSSGHAVGAGEVAGAEEGGTEASQGRPPTPMQTPPLPVAEALPLTATALDAGEAPAEAPEL